MEYVEAKTLFMIKDDLNIEYKKKVFKDIAEAKRLLHKNQLVFGDLRSTNILVTDMESSSPQGMLVDFDWGGKEGEAWYPTLQNTRDIIWPIGVGPDEYLMMEHDNVLYSWLEVEYGSCELKDVLQPEQYGKKCGFPVVDYAGINSMKKKNILSDLVKSFCDLNNFKLPSDPKVLETILLQPFCIKIPIESEVYEQWKREIIDINIDDYFVNGDLSGSTAAEFSAECVHALSRRMEGSEFRLISKFDNIVINIWETLKTYQSLAIDINRNVKDPSGITIDSLQPDVLVWVQDALVFKAEKKKDGNFSVVMEELRDKMKDWNLVSCGNLPYILSYGAVKENLQFFAITKDSNLMSISPRYNISTFAGG
ncbi:20893_t:CDS:2 [Entrophospora sp. SA101]|nr:20893_t:CDS:2 [Entrophospora sp. SA101]